MGKLLPITVYDSASSSPFSMHTGIPVQYVNFKIFFLSNRNDLTLTKTSFDFNANHGAKPYTYKRSFHNFIENKKLIFDTNTRYMSYRIRI